MTFPPGLSLCVALSLVLGTLTQHIHYVRPNGSTPCPGQPCLTLDQYAEQSSLFFKSGAMFIFLAGNHCLATGLKLANISDITLRGEKDSYISVGATVQAEYISEMNIKQLTFMLNSAKLTPNSTAFTFINSNEICLSKVTFLGNGDFSNASGAILSLHSNIALTNCTFESNTAYYGGAMYVQTESNITLDGYNSFIGNEARSSGGAIFASKSSIIIIKGMDNHFENNTASENGGAGGAISIVESDLLVSGNVIFAFNRAIRGGAIFLNGSKTLFTGKVVTFANNAADFGGGIYSYSSTLISEARQMHFIGNGPAKLGAGICSVSGQKLKISSATFTNNTTIRKYCGGAMFVENENAAVFHNLTLTGNMRSAFCIDHSYVTISGVSNFSRNSGGKGGVIYSSHSNISFEGQTLIEDNTADRGGFMIGFFSEVLFNGVTTVGSNKATGEGGAFYAVKTDIKFNGTVNFTSNVAITGGVMYLAASCTLTLFPHTTFATSLNYASEYGGVIFHEDTPTYLQCTYVLSQRGKDYIPPCFLRLKNISETSMPFEINSYNDSAGVDGGFLYGGLLDRCQMDIKFTPTKVLGTLVPYGFLMDNITHIESPSDNTTAITSQPLQLCFCENEAKYDCSRVNKISIVRGQKFTISILAVAQGDAITSSSVTTIITETSRLKESQTLLPPACTRLAYNFYSTEKRDQLILYPNGPCRDTGLARAVINVTLLPCPHAFNQSRFDCVCEKRLQTYADCFVDDYTYIRRKASSRFWMDVSIVNGSYHGLILYKTCPVQYCASSDINITLDNLNIQCDQNRGGVLCGACAANYSLLLGSARCELCSNNYLTLLLPFAAAGIALVVVLTLLRLTVATGTINSLILYANIVQTNKTLFLPIDTTNVLTVLIAWLNLDLGFQTCFYHGLDAYVITWLQFTFPLYIWILISLIVLTSRYSMTVSKLLGSNPMAVLATLLLMSYTKILKIIIEVYSFVVLEYPDNRRVTVWLKDANVPYLRSKHLILTVVTTLALVFLFLPYTLLLLLGHKLFYFSDRRQFRWLNKLKPLLDAYHAPYKSRTRYWTGFLLLVRCALYIVFSFNSLGNTTRSLLSIIVTFTSIGIGSGYLASGRIYSGFYTNVIEASIYLNLVLLSTTTLANISSPALVYILIGVVFTTMLGIVAYHFYIIFAGNLWLKLKAHFSALDVNSEITRRGYASLSGNTANTAASHGAPRTVTHTSVGLQQPIVGNC